MDRTILDKKVAFLRWFSSLEDEVTIEELVRIMKREELITAEFATEKENDPEN